MIVVVQLIGAFLRRLIEVLAEARGRLCSPRVVTFQVTRVYHSLSWADDWFMNGLNGCVDAHTNRSAVSRLGGPRP